MTVMGEYGFGVVGRQLQRATTARRQHQNRGESQSFFHAPMWSGIGGLGNEAGRGAKCHVLSVQTGISRRAEPLGVSRISHKRLRAHIGFHPTRPTSIEPKALPHNDIDTEPKSAMAVAIGRCGSLSRCGRPVRESLFILGGNGCTRNRL